MGERSSSAACSRAGGGLPYSRRVAGPDERYGGIRLGIRKDLRLRHRKDFDDVYKRGRAWNDELLVLRTLPNGLEHNRYGFVTSKKLGNAVVRNRTRRRLQESLRVQPLHPGWDIVVSAKAKAAEADFHELNRATVDLLARAGILQQDMGPAEGAA